MATRDPRAYAEWLCREPLLRLTSDGNDLDRNDLDRDDLDGDDLDGDDLDGDELDGDEPAGDGGELRGLVLRGGQGSTGLPEDNPWSLPGTIDVEDAVRHLWSPTADTLRDFVDRLARITFAIAIVRYDGRDHLVYLTAAWVSRDVPDVAAASIEELMDARELTIGDVWGSTPPGVTEDGAVAALKGPMPPNLRAIAAVHGCLTFLDEARYIDLENLEAYGEVVGRDPDGSYVMFAGMHDAWFVLDLGWIRDGLGDPTVLHHDPNDGLIPASRQPLRPFLAGHLYDMLDPDA